VAPPIAGTSVDTARRARLGPIVSGWLVVALGLVTCLCLAVLQSGLGYAAAPNKAPAATVPVLGASAFGPGKGVAVGAVALPAGTTAVELAASLTQADVLEMAVERSEKRCQGRAVAHVDIKGCENTACAEAKVRRQVLSLTDLLPGQIIRPGLVRKAAERLARLGFFRTIAVDCLPDTQGNARLTWRVVGAEVVRTIEFIGNSAIFQDELRNKLLIRPGDPLSPDTPEGRIKLQGQRETLINLYQRAGFDDAKVQVSAALLRPGQVKVRILISEGERKRINDRKLVLATLEEPGPEADAAGLWCRPISERVLLDVADLGKLDVFTQREANRVRSRVRGYLRSLGYGNPRVDVSHRVAAQTLQLDVRPGKCALVRIFIREEGGRYSLSEDLDLYAALPFGESGLYDFEESDRGREDLLAALENRGFLFADVRLDWRPVPRNMAQQVDTAITYYLTTGYISQVRGIFFHARDGADGKKKKRATFNDDALRAVISSKAYDFLDAGGFLQIDKLFADMDTMQAYHRTAGFFQFSYYYGLPTDVTLTSSLVRERRVTPQETVYVWRQAGKGFEVRKPHGENFIYVHLYYREGEQARLRKLVVQGASQVPEREVLALTGLQPGDVISAERLEQALRAVEQRYRNNGFFRMNLQALCASRGPDSPERPCSAEAVLARDVDLRIVVTEGERVDLGETFVTGNFTTDPEVLLRDMPPADEPYSAERLFDAQRRLRNLGLFTQVALQHIGDEEKPPRQKLATVVQVVEGQNRYWEALLGFQTINAARSAYEQETVQGLKGSIDRSTTASDRLSTGFGRAQNVNLPNLLATLEGAYVNRNFLGNGKSLRIAAKVGVTAPPDYSGLPYGSSAICPPTSPDVASIACTPWYNSSRKTPPWWSDTLRYASILPTYQDTRLFGSDYGLRVIAPYIVHDYAMGPIDVDKIGVLLEVTRRYGRLAASIAADGGYIQTRLPESRTQDFEDGLQRQFSLVPSLVYDNTDSPLNPTRGFSLNLSLPYINALVRSDNNYVAAQFLKFEATGKMFVPLGAVVLATALHGGAGGSALSFLDQVGLGFLGASNTRMPDFARFRLGGQYSQSLLRGYSDFGVRQYDRNGCTRVFDQTGKEKACGDPLQSSDTVRGDADVVVNGSVEVRFPLAREQGVWGGVFWDFGGLAESVTELHPAAIRHGVGLGLRWLLSGQIPVRVDYGFAIGQRCRDIPVTSSTDISCVQDEFGQLNLGLLYAF
jgi:outer membrane protein assembly factor BamA